VYLACMCKHYCIHKGLACRLPLPFRLEPRRLGLSHDVGSVQQTRALMRPITIAGQVLTMDPETVNRFLYARVQR